MGKVEKVPFSEILKVKVFGNLGQRPHVSCLSTFSKSFPSGTTRPVSFKYHLQPSSQGRKKVYIFCPGHMIKMTGMPIYIYKLYIL